MGKQPLGLTVIDLFCGAGGFSSGFHQAGFDVVLGIDNWKPACNTHTLNNLGETTSLDLFDVDIDKVLALKKTLEEKYGTIDILIGSPPCTEFSYAKNGGKGDIEKGMILVRRDLLFVALFKPKYWVMENVPRLESALSKECDGSKEVGWTIQFEKIGIPKDRFDELCLEGDSLHIPHGEVLVASDYGAHQNRKRFIAGDYPIHNLDNLKVSADTDVSLGGLISSLNESFQNPDEKGFVKDPNYPHNKVKKENIRDHVYNTKLHPMYWEEMRHYKRRHIQYGRMHLPENLKAASRTIMATYNTSSRESIILPTDETRKYQGKTRRIYRQPTVREVSCIQGFPLDFQLVASKLSNRYKLIGNAVPCQLSYAIAKSITQDIEKKLDSTDDKNFLSRAKTTLKRQQENSNLPVISTPYEVIDEALDMGPINENFKAKFTKNLRRKLLSSTIEGDSCVVIFENPDVKDGKIVGGPYWKACIQKGVGKKFHRIYIDEVSVKQLIRAMKSGLSKTEFRELFKAIVNELEKGMPVLTDKWVEFPGWSVNPDKYIQMITGKRLKIPSASFFQKAFTEEIFDLGDFISPIDFFDGLDAILLKIFSMNEFKQLKKSWVYVESLKDSNRHPYRADLRIVPRLEKVSIPIITVMAIFASVFVLNKMYENDLAVQKSDYAISLKTAKTELDKWYF